MINILNWVYIYIYVKIWEEGWLEIFRDETIKRRDRDITQNPPNPGEQKNHFDALRRKILIDWTIN